MNYKYLITILVCYIGDLLIYKFLNHVIFKTQQSHKTLENIYWFFGNLLSYITLALLYYNNIGYVYYKLNTYSLSYTIITIPTIIILIDLIFYLMHIFSHIPIIYKNFHYLHHSIRPLNSWVSRTSHIIDSNLENIAFTLPFILIPTYFPIMCIILLFTFYWGSLIHSGKKVNIKFINSGKEHGIHHIFGKKNYNFGYFTTIWDTIFGTLTYK